MYKYLYIIYMKRLDQLFSSTARTAVLNVLAFQPDSISLRQTARIARIHPYSAERALAALVNEGVVQRQRSGNTCLHALHPTDPSAAMVRAAIKAAADAAISARSHEWQSRARQILPFMHEAAAMLRKARISAPKRKNRHGP